MRAEPGGGAAVAQRDGQPAAGRRLHCKFVLLQFVNAECSQNRVAVLQSLSGTGSLRLGAAFIAKFLPGTTVHVSNPTWGNHNNIFADAGVKVGLLSCVKGLHFAKAKPESISLAGFCSQTHAAREQRTPCTSAAGILVVANR